MERVELMRTYKRKPSVNDILKSVIRILGGYMEGSDPTLEQMESARRAFNSYLDTLDEGGSRYFLRRDRQYVFPETSVVLEGGKRYRCIKSFIAPNISTYSVSKSYGEGDTVYPSVYNGYYYEAMSSGMSGGTPPLFPIVQGKKVLDNQITWKAVPDQKPSVGKNWRTFFIEDLSLTGGSPYASGEYIRSGTFELQEDEVSIEEASIMIKGEESKLSIISDFDYSDIQDKTLESEPTHLYIKHSGLTATANLWPSPKTIGEDGYILHYKARIRMVNDSNELNLPDSMIPSVTFNVANLLAPEYNISSDMQVLISQRAQNLKRGTKELTLPETTNIVVSNY